MSATPTSPRTTTEGAGVRPFQFDTPEKESPRATPAYRGDAATTPIPSRGAFPAAGSARTLKEV